MKVRALYSFVHDGKEIKENETFSVNDPIGQHLMKLGFAICMDDIKNEKSYDKKQDKSETPPEKSIDEMSKEELMQALQANGIPFTDSDSEKWMRKQLREKMSK